MTGAPSFGPPSTAASQDVPWLAWGCMGRSPERGGFGEAQSQLDKVDDLYLRLSIRLTAGLPSRGLLPQSGTEIPQK